MHVPWSRVTMLSSVVQEPPQNVTENAPVSQIRFSTIKLGIPHHNAMKYFFRMRAKNLDSWAAGISELPQNTTENASLTIRN